MTSIREPDPRDNDGVDGSDVGVSLPSTSNKRATPTCGAGSSRSSPDQCTRGVGAVLRDGARAPRGRDVQLACKESDCPVCGPKKRDAKVTRLLRDFYGKPLFALALDDGTQEWGTLQTRIERAGGTYHRVPAPGGKAYIVTTADEGVEITDREPLVRAIVAHQPCYKDDKRRMTSSRAWKGAGDMSSNGRWERVGTTHMPLGSRLKVYEEEGCHPKEVPSRYEPDDVVAAHNVTLPEENTPEMDRLARRLELRRDGPPPEGLSDWAKVIW